MAQLAPLAPARSSYDLTAARPAPPARRAASPLLPALTTTRFFAALMVVVFHTSADTPFLAQAPRSVRAVITAGYVWVGYFFILSGFILTYQYLERERSGDFDTPAFWRARIARIYPGHVLGFLLVLLVGVLPVHFAAPVEAIPPAQAALDIGLTALLSHAWVPQFALTFNFPSWSLAVEWTFYLAFPALLAFNARGSLRRMVLFAAIALALETAVTLAYCASAPQGWDGNTTLVKTTASLFIKFSPVMRLGEFVTGIALARIYSERARLGLTARHGALMIALSAAIIVAGLLESYSIPFALMHDVALSLPFAAMILGIALAPAGVVGRTLSRPWLVQLGDASYSLYILHGSLILLATYTGFSAHSVGWNGLVGRVLLVASAIALALVSNRYIEAPARAWILQRGSAPNRVTA
ncbi:MAG: mdmB [Gemmatimonadetes bacterium]|nr:mdmB [Gemmatimonadota bacterium]